MPDEMQEAGEKPGRGRPRAPGLEERVVDAAIAAYALGGGAGFTFDGIARSAGVGKSALYRRWPSRDALLRETLEARWYAVQTIDSGTLRGDLLALARMTFDSLVGPHGEVGLHLREDSRQFPELRAIA